MDRHIAEHAARTGDVIMGRRAWIARGNRHHLHLANGTGVNLAAHFHEIGVKAPVETHHQLGFFLHNGGQALAHAIH